MYRYEPEPALATAAEPSFAEDWSCDEDAVYDDEDLTSKDKGSSSQVPISH